ncbi:MAG: hydrogenase nickel incorporation protein HypB [Nitrospinae bacterium]|nr:hydrogenase nickel incorporation protein HypB [Nitrospinota bacterium]
MTTTIHIDKKILEKNEVCAERLKKMFFAKNIVVVNFMSSPGAGKTTLLEKTIAKISRVKKTGVIEGDIATDGDARRIESAGAGWVLQINTDGICHLDASMVEKAVAEMPQDIKLLIIENVGNLVCPSGFDLGDDHKIIVGSLAEGLDKPKKYPGMYRKSDALVVNKIDLAPYVNVDPDKFVKEALEVNPNLRVFKTSATTGEGLDEFCDWLTGLTKKDG